MFLQTTQAAILVLISSMVAGQAVPAFAQQPNGTQPKSPDVPVTMPDGADALAPPDLSEPAQEAQTELAPPDGDPEFQQVLGAIEALNSNQPIDGVTALAILAIGSFFVDRISTGVLTFLSLSGFWRRLFPNPATMPSDVDPKLKSAARTKLVAVYYILAALVAIGLVGYFGHVKLFSALGFGEMDPILDSALTGLMMVIGAERVAQWLNLPGSPGVRPTEAQPVTIVGDLLFKEASRMLDEATGSKTAEVEPENPK